MNKTEMLNFLDNKFRNCNPEFLKLSQVYFEDSDENSFRDFIKQIANTIGADWVNSGCSKSVFHFKEFDNYVFKIPYIGYFYIEDEDTQYFKECAEQERVPTYFCFDDVALYKNANNDGTYPVDANDYCAVEEYIYRIARKYNVNQMFTKTAFLGFVCGIPVYVSSCAGKATILRLLANPCPPHSLSPRERGREKQEVRRIQGNRGRAGLLNIHQKHFPPFLILCYGP